MGKKTAAVASGYRLSPGEIEALIQEAKQKRRIKRILQVREQAKANAADILQAVREEEVKQKKELGKKILKEWESEREAKLKRLEQEYDACLRTIGQGHAEAHYVEKENRDLAKKRLTEKDAEIAAARHRDAMLRELDERRADQMERTKQIRARNAAILKEKERAAKVAALPPPKPDPWADVELPKHKPVVLVDAEAFSSTYFHMVDEDYAVQKAMSFEQVDAIEAAKDEEDRVEEVQENIERLRHERAEKARLRGKHALYKEHLKFEYENMLHDLSDLQREDINRRQREVANIPRSIFQPPHRRLVEKEETQKDMETAFEDMFMKQTDQMGDVSLALDPHPVPESPAVSDDLNVSYEDDTAMASQGPEKFEDKRAAALKDITNSLADKQKDGSKSLKKMMNRIKDQRDAWITQNTQEVPEQDTLQPPATFERSPQTVPSPQDRSPSQYSVTSTETGSSSSGDDAPRPRLAQGIRQVHFNDRGPTVHRHSPAATPKPPVLIPPQPFDDGVLRHPLEEAAKIRAAAQKQILNVDKQLINFETVRAREDFDNISIVKHDTSTLGQQARQQRMQLDEHSKEIERKIAELEAKRKMIEERERVIKSRPGSLYPHETLPGASERNYLAASAPALVSRPGFPVRDSSTRAYDWMAPSSLPTRPEVYAAPRPQQDHLQRLRDYQRSLLERHKSASLTPLTSFSSRSDPDASTVSASYLSSSVYGQPGGRPQYALYPQQDLSSFGHAAQVSRPQTVDTSRQFGAVSRLPPAETFDSVRARQPGAIGAQDISRQSKGLDTSMLSMRRSPEPVRRTSPEVYQPIRRQSPDVHQPVSSGPTHAADLSSATRQLFSSEQTIPKQTSPPRVSPPKVDASRLERPVQTSLRSPQGLVERPEPRFDETGRFSYPYEGTSDTSEATTRVSYPFHPADDESTRGTSTLSRHISPQVSPTTRVSPAHVDSTKSDDQMKIAEIYERQQQIEQRKEALQRELDDVRQEKKELLNRSIESQASPGENWSQKLQEWMAPLGMSSQVFEATPDRSRTSMSSEDHTVEIDEKLIEELDQMYSDESSPESEAGKRPRPPPLSKKIICREDTVPHELSTIQEVETSSDKTAPSIASPGTIASASFSTLEPSPRIPSASSTPNITPGSSPVKVISISKDVDTTISEFIQSQRETTPVGSPTSVRKQYLERGYEPSPGGIIHMTPSAGQSEEELRRRSEPSRRAVEPSYRTPSPSLVIPPKKTPVFKEKLDQDDLLKRLSVGKGSQSMRTPPATWSTVLQDESLGLSSGLISSDETRISSGEDRFSSLTSHTITSTDQSTLQEKSTLSLRERLAAGISGASESSSQSDSYMTGASPMVHLAQKSVEITQYHISSSESEVTETTSSSMNTGSATEMFELMAYTTGTSSFETPKTSSGEEHLSSRKSPQDLTQHTITSQDDTTLMPSFKVSPKQDLTRHSIASADVTKKSPEDRRPKEDLTQHSMVSANTTQVSPKEDLTQYSMTSADQTRVSQKLDLTQYSFASVDETRPSPSDRESMLQSLIQYTITSGDVSRPSSSEKASPMQTQNLTQYSIASEDVTRPSPSPSDKSEKASPMQTQNLTQYSIASEDVTRPSPSDKSEKASPMQTQNLTQYSIASEDVTRPSPSDKSEKASPMQTQNLTQYSIASEDVTRPSPSDKSEKASPMQTQNLTQYSIASEDVTRPSPSDKSEKASPMHIQDLTQYTLGDSTPSDSESLRDRGVPGLRVEPATPLPGSGRPSPPTNDTKRDTIGSMATPGPLQYHDLTQYSLMSQDRIRYSPTDETARTDPSPFHRQQHLTQHSIVSDESSSTPDHAKLPDLTQYSIPSDEQSPYEKTNDMQELSQHTLTTGTESATSDFISLRSDTGISQHTMDSDSSKTTAVEESIRKDGTQMKSPQPDLTQIPMSTERSTPEGTGPHQPDLTQYSIVSESDAQQSRFVKSVRGVSLGEMITPQPTEKVAELSQHPITEQSVYPESSPGSSDFGTLTPQDSVVAETTSVSNVPSPDMSTRTQDSSISQYPVPSSDVSYSQHPFPQSDLSTSQHPIPQSNLSISQHPVPASDMSTSQHPIPQSNLSISQHVVPASDMSTSQHPIPQSNLSISQHVVPASDMSTSQHPIPQSNLSISQHPVPASDMSTSQHPIPQSNLSISQHVVPASDMSTSQHPIPQSNLSISQHVVPASDMSTSQHPIPPSDVDITQVPFQTDMSTTQLTLPPSDASISQHSIHGLSISQHPMAQTELSISQYPVSEGSEKWTPATSLWLTDASRQTVGAYKLERDVDRQIESSTSYLSQRELMESGESLTDASRQTDAYKLECDVARPIESSTSYLSQRELMESGESLTDASRQTNSYKLECDVARQIETSTTFLSQRELMESGESLTDASRQTDAYKLECDVARQIETSTTYLSQRELMESGESLTDASRQTDAYKSELDVARQIETSTTYLSQRELMESGESLTDVSRQTDVYKSEHDVARQIETSTTYLSQRELMSSDYQHNSGSESGESLTDRIVADTKRLREKQFGARSSEESTFETFSNEGEFGIMDEPELTFSSLVSETTSDPGTLTSGAEDEGDLTFTGEQSDSLLSFQEHEMLVGEDSLVSLTPETSAMTEEFPDASTSTQSSLQEAFAKKREAFIKKSQKRVQEIKTKPTAEKTRADSHGKTLAAWRKSRAINTGTSGAVAAASAGAKPKISMTVKTQEDRKEFEKEMKKRTGRLYSNLDEVKERKAEKERRKEYKENREKAREYQKKMLEQVRKKSNGNGKK